MEFLNPAALLGLVALPLLLIPYLIRKKPRRVVFSSLLLFREEGAQAQRSFGRIHLPPLFFLQLLLLALLVLSLSEPVFSVRPSHVALVLDNSASMQALESGRSRFDLARERLGAIVGELGPSATVDVYVTTPRLAKVNAAAWSPAQAVENSRKLRPRDLGDAAIDYDEALHRLVQEQKYERVYLFTDLRAAGQSAAIRLISVGQPQANLAVASFEVHRGSLAGTTLEAEATLANLSARDETVQVALKSDGATLASRQVRLAADQTAAVSFTGLPQRPFYEIEIVGRDALALDNRRFAVAPRSRNLRILAVTPRPQSVASLNAVPGVTVEAVAPEAYGGASRRGHDLELFHYASPARLPDVSALFILPPETSSLVDLGAPATNPQISGWREPHRLTRYVNFSLLRPTYARPLRPQAAGRVILEGPDGALAFAVERNGARHLVLGFDPLPYLGRDNLPMSIFTLNILDWFVESGGVHSQATGEPIALGSVQTGDSLTTPAGERENLERGTAYFTPTYQQGLYRVNRSAGGEWFARNLEDLGESDLRNTRQVRWTGQTSGIPAASPSVLFSFWPYLLSATLVLFMIEWLVFPRSSSAIPRFARGRGRLALRR